MLTKLRCFIFWFNISILISDYWNMYSVKYYCDSWWFYIWTFIWVSYISPCSTKHFNCLFLLYYIMLNNYFVNLFASHRKRLKLGPKRLSFIINNIIITHYYSISVYYISFLLFLWFLISLTVNSYCFLFNILYK